MNRQLRARIVLEEARALGIDLGDLIAVATGEHRPITVTAWIDQITPTFSGSTARTYRCLLYTSPSPRDLSTPRMPSSA